ncbi:lamin tail domain-containing protein [Kangiella sp. HZ709]|uniref:lamin tail domain-containing protein n=1 Tax=Kangiella sp. HZ709 TaxID=2666328 RepID=UPI0012B0CE93|nr:lamin tail domain-containing protein [Kangiella sp. HZ709]MRX26642.1 DUF11 domain-containing protein [Kangiella sp. HZ709]
MKRNNLFIAALITTGFISSQTANSAVVINEVLFDQTGGAGASVNDEFIELYNNGSTNIDISNYVLADGSISPNTTDGLNFTFPASTVIPAYGYLVVWVGVSTNPDNNAPSADLQLWLGLSAQLNNTADDVRLYDSSGSLIDFVGYGSTSASAYDGVAASIWNTAINTTLDNTAKGRSISLTPNGVDSNDSRCWTRTTGSDAIVACPNVNTLDTDPVFNGSNQRVSSVGRNNNQASDISVIKTDSSTSYTPGSSSTYQLQVTNDGPDDVTGLLIEDTLPNGVSFNGAISCTPVVACSLPATNPPTGQTLSFSLDVTNGQTVIVSVPIVYSINPSDY